MMSNAFEHLRFSNVDLLMDVLVASKATSVGHLQRVYCESAECFTETVAFLSRLGVVKESSGDLQLQSDWRRLSKDQRRTVVLSEVMRVRNRYRSEILRFLERFEIVDSDVVYFSSAQGRSKESAVRNFLIEIGVVRHLIGKPKYVLKPEHVSLYASARDKTNFYSPSSLARNLAAKSDIGLAAEEEILTYEQNRIRPSLHDRIRHVSLKNVAAGYDIRSVTVCNDDQIVPRFIEVKAVSSRTYRFYWSRNEVSVARSLGHWYYLYLLPVDRNGRFDLRGLNIIADPYSQLLANEAEWICETDGLACYLAAPITSPI